MGTDKKCFYQPEMQNLMQHLISVWAELKQTIVNKATGQWQTRLRACFSAKGQHFEHLLN